MPFLRVPRFNLSANTLALLALSFTTAFALPAIVSGADELYGAPPKDLNVYLERLVHYYSGTISRHDAEFLYLKDGTKFQISDHRTDKTFHGQRRNRRASMAGLTLYDKVWGEHVTVTRRGDSVWPLAKIWPHAVAARRRYEA